MNIDSPLLSTRLLDIQFSLSIFSVERRSCPPNRIILTFAHQVMTSGRLSK